MRTRSRLAAAALIVAGCGRAPAPKPAPAEAPAPRFVDATDAAGLNFRQHFGGCGKRYFVEQVASGAALFDADGDGDLDIYFPQPTALGECKLPEPAHPKLFLGDGTGRFTLAKDAFGSKDTDYGIAAAAGDFDNDGRCDLYVCCYGRNTLWRNVGGGKFVDVTKTAGVALGGFSTGAVWLDADGDGRLDLYVLRYCEWSVDRDITCPGGACGPTTYTAARNAFFHNNGDGTFTDQSARSGLAAEQRRSLGAAAADFDADGKLDLFVANDLGPNSLFRGKGDGTFEEMGMMQGVAYGITGSAQANMGVAVGDYDGDADLDVVITTFQNEPYTLYRNDGTYFTDASGESGIAAATLPYLAFGTGFVDTTNSGRLDLFFANGHVNPTAKSADGKPHTKQPNQLLVNQGDGRFVDTPAALPEGDIRIHRGACFGDIDGDGRIDILTTATDDRPTLLRNDSPAGRSLIVRLVPKNGCATPIGARAVATVAGKRLLRVVLGGGSYGGSSDTRLHFGLGDAATVDRLEIRWMSGKTQTLEKVAAGALTVREP